MDLFIDPLIADPLNIELVAGNTGTGGDRSREIIFRGFRKQETEEKIYLYS
jgi:hypothetical protein